LINDSLGVPRTTAADAGGGSRGPSIAADAGGGSSSSNSLWP